jgi:hypothetical protein
MGDTTMTYRVGASAVIGTPRPRWPVAGTTTLGSEPFVSRLRKSPDQALNAEIRGSGARRDRTAGLLCKPPFRAGSPMLLLDPIRLLKVMAQA